MATRLTRALQSVAQRLLFSYEQFSRHEMANHAAAGAYSFLLSAVPGLLVVVSVTSMAFNALHLDPRAAADMLGPFLESLGGREALGAFLGKPVTVFAGAFGIVSLVWAARLFIVSIQRGLRVVHAEAASGNAVRNNVLTFAMELIVFLVVIALLAVSQALTIMVSTLDSALAMAVFGRIVPLAARAMPLVALWCFVYLSYRLVPARKPPKATAAVTTTLCIVAFAVLSYLLGTFSNTERYGLLYGILGNLIATLIRVYFFFYLYFYFAELGYTVQNFDSLLFARFHKVSSDVRSANAMEKALFAEPSTLMAKFAHTIKAGRVIFAKGDAGMDAYYLYKGKVGIYLTRPEPAAIEHMDEENGAPMPVADDGEPDTLSMDQDALSVVGEGAFFGEMAYLLDEYRSAWAIALTECTVFQLPPPVFERYLAHDADASGRLVSSLAARLKANNDILSRGGQL